MDKNKLNENQYLNNEKKLIKIDKEANDKIGIMGGTFDPIHQGHLAMAEFIRDKYELDKIIFIPSGNPPHKRNKTTNKFDRYNMCLLATESNEEFAVLDIEINREKNTYTSDTLEELSTMYPNSKIYFITGADAICEIESWKDVEKNFKLATFIATTRPGISEDKSNQKISELIRKYNAEILKVHTPSLDISSTYVRERVCMEKTIKYIVPKEVEEYIYDKHLYKNGE